MIPEARRAAKRSALLCVSLLLLLLAEKTLLLTVDYGWLPHWTDAVRGAPLLFGLALLFFGRKQLRRLGWPRFAANRGAALVHISSVVLYVFLAHALRSHRDNHGTPGYTALAAVCVVLVPVALLSLICAFLRRQDLGRITKGLGVAWVYAALVALALAPMRNFARLSWDAPTSKASLFLQNACLSQTSALLRHLYPYVYVDYGRQYLGTPKFIVQVAGLCSGIEGLSLVLLLVVAWLVIEHRTLRIGRALLILPVALGVSWMLNVSRLAVLIIIGNAGHPNAAMRGFHQQGGWIALNFACLAGLWLVQRIQWFHKVTPAHAASEQAEEPGRNYAVLFLAPFAAIMAASMVSQALSSGFERLYPIRFVAALLVLWAFRNEYRKLDWKFGLLGPAAGLLVGLGWIGLYLLRIRYGMGPAPATYPVYLAPRLHFGWIVVRVAAAVITVPIAEELAFRGFLARRIMSEGFEAIPYRTLSLPAIAISSIAFGLMHGHMWLAGTVAGVIFALVAKARNRIGEAVAAHAVANLLIAGLVLARGDYSLW